MSNTFVDFHNEQNECLDTLYAAQQQMSKLYMTGRGMWLELRNTISNLQQKNAELCKMVDVLRERLQPQSINTLDNSENRILDFLSRYKELQIASDTFGCSSWPFDVYFVLIGYWVGDAHDKDSCVLAFANKSHYPYSADGDSVMSWGYVKKLKNLRLSSCTVFSDSDHVRLVLRPLPEIEEMLSVVKCIGAV